MSRFVFIAPITVSMAEPEVPDEEPTKRTFPLVPDPVPEPVRQPIPKPTRVPTGPVRVPERQPVPAR